MLRRFLLISWLALPPVLAFGQVVSSQSLQTKSSFLATGTNAFIMSSSAKLCGAGSGCSNTLSWNGTQWSATDGWTAPSYTATVSGSGNALILSSGNSKVCWNGSSCSIGTYWTGSVVNTTANAQFNRVDINGVGTVLNTSGQLTIGTSGTTISGSYRGTATLATSAISANLCAAEQSITVTNSATGADCVVGMPTTIENGLIWTCYVSAAGTVKLRVCNHTAGSITPAGSQTVAVRVFNP